MTQKYTKPEVENLAYLGRHSEALSDLIEAQTAELFARRGIRVPVKSSSLVDALDRCEPASASDLANIMGRSHQIVMQKLPKLIRLGFVERSADPDDGRRYFHRLTAAGREQLKRLRDLLPKIADAYREIEGEIGPVNAQICSTIKKLQSVDLLDRVNSNNQT